jgi:hypothetical protein
MTERHTPAFDRSEAEHYEIRLTGHLDAHWTAWFDGLTVSHQDDGTTVIRGPVADQAALHGLLQRVRDLGLPLVSVERVEDDQPNGMTPPRDSAIKPRHRRLTCPTRPTPPRPKDPR